MATYGLFISATDVKQTTFVDENVDDMDIKKIIIMAQDMHITTLLGTALYDEINTAVINASATTDQLALLTKIKPVLLWYTLYEGVIPLSIKIKNKGVMKMNSENSQPVDNDGLIKLMDYFKDRAEEYAERCKNYLIENATAKFPSYNNAGSGADTIHPEKNQYGVNWVLGSTYQNKCRGDIERFDETGNC